MSSSPRYSLLPGTWQADGRVNTLLIIHGTAVPVVPAGSCLLLLVGLIMWSVGMLQARSTVGGIFSDLGVEADSLDQLQVTVLVAVVVLSLLVLLVLAANVWLEVSSSSSSKAGPASLQAYATNTFRVNVCNWVLLLLVALAMAGSITWLTTMSTALSAVQQSGGGGYGSSTVWTPDSSSSSSSSAHQALKMPLPLDKVGASSPSSSSSSGSSNMCPPGCVDLGLIAKVLGMPWPCFCQVWLLGDLLTQLQQVVAQLWVAVSGALLLFVSTSWLYGYLAAQGAHAARDMQQQGGMPAAREQP